MIVVHRDRTLPFIAHLPRPVAVTNGVFDGLHAGHCALIGHMSLMSCNYYQLVLVNSDESATLHKRKPKFSDEHRAYCVASLRFVDAVIIFDQPTVAEMLELIKPDLYVKSKKAVAEVGGQSNLPGIEHCKKFVASNDISDVYGVPLCTSSPI